MNRPRFQPLAVEHRGYPVARIRDTRTGRELYIYRRGRRYLHWDRSDEPVQEKALRAAARQAFELHAEADRCIERASKTTAAMKAKRTATA